METNYLNELIVLWNHIMESNIVFVCTDREDTDEIIFVTDEYF